MGGQGVGGSLLLLLVCLSPLPCWLTLLSQARTLTLTLTPRTHIMLC